MIQFQNVSKNFGNLRVLNDLSFSVLEGSTFALLGLSGSGKTTALKIIAGLQIPDSGKVRINGIEVEDRNLATVRSRIGYVVQEGGLFPHLTAFENLEIVGREAGWDQKTINSRVSELLDLAR